jgi:hypothetical protein
MLSPRVWVVWLLSSFMGSEDNDYDYYDEEGSTTSEPSTSLEVLLGSTFVADLALVELLELLGILLLRRAAKGSHGYSTRWILGRHVFDKAV